MTVKNVKKTTNNTTVGLSLNFQLDNALKSPVNNKIINQKKKNHFGYINF